MQPATGSHPERAQRPKDLLGAHGPVARGFGEILRRLASGVPPQDDKGHRKDLLDNAAPDRLTKSRPNRVGRPDLRDAMLGITRIGPPRLGCAER